MQSLIHTLTIFQIFLKTHLVISLHFHFCKDTKAIVTGRKQCFSNTTTTQVFFPKKKVLSIRAHVFVFRASRQHATRAKDARKRKFLIENEQNAQFTKHAVDSRTASTLNQYLLMF